MEFDSPYQLLCRGEEGVLAELARQTGDEAKDKLVEKARLAEQAKEVADE